MILLGIETSCDETAAAVVENTTVRANILFTHTAHAQFGGVVPEIASREHLRLLPGLVRQALDESGVSWEQLDGIAFTRGPGLAGPLLVGASFARALALESGLPLYGVNHLEGHLAAVRLSYPDLTPPFLCLTVSGGHTELTLLNEAGEFVPVGETRDDAAGEAFDKCGKLMGLGYPAGPILSRIAETGNRKAFAFPKGLRLEEGFDFSFSGLKSAVSREVSRLGPEQTQVQLADLCASVESAIVDALVDKTIKAAQHVGTSTIAVCGGVSANRFLREQLTQRAKTLGMTVVFPALALCTDNAAMIAGAAIWALEQGKAAKLIPEVDPRLALVG